MIMSACSAHKGSERARSLHGEVGNMSETLVNVGGKGFGAKSCSREDSRQARQIITQVNLGSKSCGTIVEYLRQRLGEYSGCPALYFATDCCTVRSARYCLFAPSVLSVRPFEFASVLSATCSNAQRVQLRSSRAQNTRATIGLYFVTPEP